MPVGYDREFDDEQQRYWPRQQADRERGSSEQFEDSKKIHPDDRERESQRCQDVLRDDWSETREEFCIAMITTTAPAEKRISV